MSLSRKHYQQLVSIVANILESIGTITEPLAAENKKKEIMRDMCDFLKAVNSNFDKYKFINAIEEEINYYKK